MGKRIDTVTGVVNIASTVVNAAVAIVGTRRAEREAKQKAEDEAKDKRIKELEAEVKSLTKGP